MPSDFTMLLTIGIPAALMGLVTGVLLIRFAPDFSAQYANWSMRLPWWFFLAGAGFFVLMASNAADAGKPSFAFAFLCGAVLDFVSMGMALYRKLVRQPAGVRDESGTALN